MCITYIFGFNKRLDGVKRRGSRESQRMAKIKLSPNGKWVKIKVRGRKRIVREIPFRDQYRKRAFKTLKLLIKHLNFKDVKEESSERGLHIEYGEGGDLHTCEIPILDKILFARLSSSSNSNFLR